MKITRLPNQQLTQLKRPKAPQPTPEPQPPKDGVQWSKVGRGALNGAAVMTLASGAAKLTNLAGFTFMRQIGLADALIGIAAGAVIGGFMVHAGMKGSLPEQ